MVILGTRTAGPAAFRGLGLARAVPAVDRPCWPSAPGSACDERVAGLPEDEGQRAHVQGAAVRDSFGRWKNLKIVLLALFGLVAGQAVVWYTGQFYALFFLHSVLKVDADTANVLVAVSLIIGTPFFVVFGTLSDKIGRKPIILAGCPAGRADLLPAVQGADQAANPELAKAQATAQISRQGRPASCSFQGSPIAREVDFSRPATSPSAHWRRARPAMPTTAACRPVRPRVVKIGDKELTPPTAVTAGRRPQVRRGVDQGHRRLQEGPGEALKAAGYPPRPSRSPSWAAWWQVVASCRSWCSYVTMVYGPIAAMLVELFPTRIRYTSMSLPYHIGNGWFGGLLPSVTFAMVAANGNMYYGLWYPIVIAAVCFVIGLIFVRETKDVDIYAHD
jgi:hypothetical protein